MKLETLAFFEEHLGDDVPVVSLLDVGVSGGINHDWRYFGNRLSALGVDPLVAEIERLNHEEINPKVKYLSAYVVWSEWADAFPEDTRNQTHTGSFERTSAYQSMQNYKENYTRDNYNSKNEIVYTDKKVGIDELIADMPEQRADFIKTDTDGYDFPALLSGRVTLGSSQVLGLQVECNFHSADHPYANNFANIDQFLRSMGFTLFDLKTYNYSRAVLPARFMYKITAQTHSGSAQWADAYYFRDFCNPRFSSISGWQPTKDHIVRQVMLLEFFGHVDSAVELMLQYKTELGIENVLPALLDKLVKRYCEPDFGETYEELIGNFKEDYTRFFPK